MMTKLGNYTMFATTLLGTHGLLQSKWFSNFSVTAIKQNTCTDVATSTIIAVSRITCGLSCSQELQCRRYLFCSSDSTCKLYQDGTDCIMPGDSTSCTCFRKDIGCHGINCTCPLGYYGDDCQDVVTDCKVATTMGMGDNLLQSIAETYIQPNLYREPFEVECLLEYGGALIILRRRWYCSPSESFNRSLPWYEEGFGQVPFNRWIGFTNLLGIYDIYSGSSFALQIRLTPSLNPFCDANYGNFRIGNKSTGYKLSTSGYTGGGSVLPCGDSILGNVSLYGTPFSTYDADYTGRNECAVRFGGGWWFKNSSECTRSFLTGEMNGSGNTNFWLDNADDPFSAILFIFWVY